jgi:hypothetical protein
MQNNEVRNYFLLRTPALHSPLCFSGCWGSPHHYNTSPTPRRWMSGCQQSISTYASIDVFNIRVFVILFRFQFLPLSVTCLLVSRLSSGYPQICLRTCDCAVTLFLSDIHILNVLLRTMVFSFKYSITENRSGSDFDILHNSILNRDDIRIIV